MKHLLSAGAFAALLLSSPVAFAQIGGGAIGGGGIGGLGDADHQMQPSAVGLSSVEGYPERRTRWLNPRSPDYAVAPAYPPGGPYNSVPYGYVPQGYVPYGVAAAPAPVYAGRSVYRHRHAYPRHHYRVFRPY